MDPESTILESILNQNVEEFQAAVAAHPNCNFNKTFEHLDGQTMFHAAAMAYELDFVKFLISKKADARVLDNKCRSPAYLASVYGNTDVLLLILYEEFKADFPNEDHGEKRNHDMAMTMVNYLKECKWKHCNLFTENKPSVLHASCAAGWYDIVEILLTFYAAIPESSRPSINTPDHQGFSPTVACMWGLVGEARKAQTANQDNGEPKLEYTAEQTKLFRNHIQIIVWMEQYGADLTTFDHRTILQISVQENLMELVEKLISKGVDVNKLSDDVPHPLYTAINMKLHDMIELLCVEGGADAHSPITTQVPSTILDDCISFSTAQTLLYVLNYCRTIDMSRVNHAGLTPLALAVTHYIAKDFAATAIDFGDDKESEEAAKQEADARLDVVKVLIGNQADPFQVVGGAGSVMDMIIISDKLDLMEYLIGYADNTSWNIDKQNVDGWTPLLLAMHTYFKHNHGTKEKKMDMFTPLSVDTTMVDFMLQAGADPDLEVTFRAVTTDEDADLDSPTSMAAQPFGFKLFSNENQNATLSADQVLAQMNPTFQQKLQRIFDANKNANDAADEEE